MQAPRCPPQAQALDPHAREDAGQTPTSRPIAQDIDANFRGQRLRGFTLVEIIVVLAIGVILAGMSLPGVISVIGKTKINKSAEAVVVVARQARQLALTRVGDGGTAYGVCLAQDAAGRSFATVIHGGPGDGKANHKDREVLTPTGKPAMRQYLPADAEFWVGNIKLQDTAGSELAWYFASRSGRPMAMQGSSFSPSAIAVGFTPGAITSGQLSNAWGVAGYNVSMTVLAPSVANAPGLSVRSGRSSRGLQLYPTGFLTVVEP